MPTRDEWPKVLKHNTDINFTTYTTDDGYGTKYEAVSYKSPFKDEYFFDFHYYENASTVSAIYIGGFTLNQNVVDLIKKDSVEFEIKEDEKSRTYLLNGDLKDEYFKNKKRIVTIYSNGTIWVGIQEPK